MNKGLIVLTCLLLGQNLFASLNKKPQEHSDEIYLTIGSDALHGGLRSIGDGFEILQKGEDVSLVRLSRKNIERLSDYMHDTHKRCGGFMGFDSLEDASNEFNGSRRLRSNQNRYFVDYTINQPDLVAYLTEEVDEFNIESTIRHLSSYKNRFYKSNTGVEAAQWIANYWRQLAAHRSDISVEEYQHNWAQPSVVATIPGHSEEVIVLGGHLDSIAGWFGGSHAKAPGADDNASGIATLTEVFRIISQSNYVPEKTIMFMGYAAEEVGLWGSKEIARLYSENEIPVVGVLQLDMTNYNGSNVDINLISDYTNREQNEFVAALIDTYFQYKWTYDRCGYACSDHASWNSQGYAASFPFEAKNSDMNSNIHTKRDTIDISGGNASHAAKFAKIALAYLVELDR